MKHTWILLICAALLVLVLSVRARAGLSVEAAREKLRQGAKLIDVRTPEEFADHRVPGAMNIPLDVIARDLPRQFPDHSTVLLLHCRSGRRSGIAEKELRALGSTNAYNVGSFEQARQVASEK